MQANKLLILAAALSCATARPPARPPDLGGQAVHLERLDVHREVHLRTLDARPLKEWQTLCDALPQRFAKALNAAAKLLEPKAVPVQLPKRTLKTEQEVDAWLDSARKVIVTQLKDGPVIV